MTEETASKAEQPASTPDRAKSPVARFASNPIAGKATVVVALSAAVGLWALSPWKDQPKAREVAAGVARQIVKFEGMASGGTFADPGREPQLEPQGDPAAGLDVAGDLNEPIADDDRARRTGSSTATSRPAPLMAWSRRTNRAQAASGSEPFAEPITVQGSAASVVETAKARRLGDRSYLLLAGTVLPCTLQTALDSSVPGKTVCLVGRDVWSDNGAVVLMEKGTRVLGEFRQGLRSGEGRLHVLWTRAVTPNGVSIELASPASDALGRSGFGGDVERHFWRRFGGAVLLSLVDDAAVAAFDRRDGAGGAARLPSDAAAIALDRSIDIAPTLRKAQGEQVSIFVAKDLDFSDVYQLEAR